MLVKIWAKPPYCQPSDITCWPNAEEINEFSKQLDGSLILKDMSDQQYINLTTKVYNIWTISYPAFIVLISSHQDVQNCVKFASTHNIQLSIQSTGHSYSGRNSANNSLQINLNSIQSYKFDIDASPPTITVETGLRWGKIYELVNSTFPDYVIIGGGDPSVGPAGYSSLGGHSPLTPRYGLSIDHIQQYHIVLANSEIVRVYDTQGKNQSVDQLFWSLKGGGAETFGVVLNITYKLNKVESEPGDVYNLLACTYPLYSRAYFQKDYIGDDILYNYFDYVQNGFDSSVTGYFEITFTDQYGYDSYNFEFAMMYYGNSSYGKQVFQPLMELNPYNNITYCSLSEYKYFWDIWSLIPGDLGGYPNYIANDFIPKSNLTKDYADLLLLMMNETNITEQYYGFYVATGTMIGGYNNLDNFPYGVNDSVGMGFRSSYFSMSLNFLWNDPGIYSKNESINDVLKNAKAWESKFRKYGNGIYSNEENSECGDGCDWKQEFWGQSNYDKLLKVKNSIDPNQVFWCNHCIGSDQ